MSEHIRPEVLTDPTLTPAQEAERQLCLEILQHKPEHIRLTSWTIPIEAEAEAVEARLRESAVGHLMLKDGETLSAPGNGEYYPDLDMRIGEVRPSAIVLRAWLWESDKYRIDPSGPEEPPYKFIEYPGEKDWSHELDIEIWYDDKHVMQKIGASTSSQRAGTTPGVARDVWASAYAETGYEGHNQVFSYDVSDPDVLAFIGLARELYEKRVQE